MASTIAKIGMAIDAHVDKVGDVGVAAEAVALGIVVYVAVVFFQHRKGEKWSFSQHIEKKGHLRQYMLIVGSITFLYTLFVHAIAGIPWSFVSCSCRTIHSPHSPHSVSSPHKPPHAPGAPHSSPDTPPPARRSP